MSRSAKKRTRTWILEEPLLRIARMIVEDNDLVAPPGLSENRKLRIARDVLNQVENELGPDWKLAYLIGRCDELYREALDGMWGGRG